MLAINTKESISLITKLAVYQENNKYMIQYNNKDCYKTYNTKEEAMTDFIRLSNYLKKSSLKILTKEA